MKAKSVLTSAIVLLALGGCFRDETILQPSQTAEPEQGNGESTGDANSQAQGLEPAAETDAMSLYRQAQHLMEAGRREEGYDSAKRAMTQFIAEDDGLVWMLLESITVGDRRIDVHFNMGPSERERPDNGIVRPLSFRVWSTGDDADLLEIIDFEIGRSGGESMTAAIGKMDGTTHLNFGMLPVDSSYEIITKAVIDLVRRSESGNE